MPEEELETPEEKEMNKEAEKKVSLNSEERKTIIKQIEKEYLLSYDSTEAKRTESLRRLKLFNNQKRDQSKVGDPLLFTVFQTVLANLYEDRLSITHGANEEGDDEVAENLDALALHDHRIMEKDELDYEWDWDTAFFGRGLVLLSEFDRSDNVMCPVAEVIDPMTWVRDPRASSVN